VAGLTSGGGSAYTDEYLSSLTAMTLARAVELRKLTQWEESQEVSK